MEYILTVTVTSVIDSQITHKTQCTKPVRAETLEGKESELWKTPKEGMIFK